MHNRLATVLLPALILALLLPAAAIAGDDSAPRLVPRDDGSTAGTPADSETPTGAPRLISSDEDDPTAAAHEPQTPSLRQRLYEAAGSGDATYFEALDALTASPDLLSELAETALEETQDGRVAHVVLRDAVYGSTGGAGRAALSTSLLAALPSPKAPTQEAAPALPTPSTLWDAITTFAASAAAAAAAVSPSAAQLQVQRDYLRWQGLVADEQDAGAIAAYLHDPSLGDAAVAALARIPGTAVDNALVAGLAGTAPKRQILIAQALGQRGLRSNVQALVSLARTSPSREVIWASLEALAALGEPPTTAVKPDPNFTREESARFALLGLVAAGQLEARGDRRTAERIYLSFMNLYSRRAQLRTALLGLSRLGSSALFEHAMGFMNTPGVRESAIEALASAQIPGIEDQLANAFNVTDPSMRAGILQVLKRRGSEQVQLLLPAALLTDSLELRTVAADIAGIAVPDKDLLRLAREGNPWIRGEALRRYLDRAEAQRAKGNAAAARDPLLQVAQGPFPAPERMRAITALSAYDDAEVAGILQNLAQDPAVAEAAYRARTTVIAGASEDDTSRTALNDLAASAESLETVAIAADAMEKQGDTVTPLAEQWGFLTDWQLLDPVPDYETSYFNETAVRSPAEVRAGESTLGWTAGTAAGLPAVLEVSADPGDAVYARTTVSMPKWTTAELRIGSTGPLKLWLNGELVHTVDECRVLEADDDLVQIVLQPGINHVLAKIAVGDGPARVTIRVTDRGGKAQNLTVQEMPDDGATGVGTRPNALLGTISEEAP